MDLFEGAAALGDYLIVIVNNDVAQMLKKGKIILDEQNRLRLVQGLRLVDEALISIDGDSTVRETLRMIAKKYPDDELLFANGGDRSIPTAVPEAGVCKEFNIVAVYGIGGTSKSDSSTRINQALGLQD